MFSKQHYRFLEDWLNTAAIATTDPMAVNLIASSLADRLSIESHRFDRAKFLRACGNDRRSLARIDREIEQDLARARLAAGDVGKPAPSRLTRSSDGKGYVMPDNAVRNSMR